MRVMRFLNLRRLLAALSALVAAADCATVRHQRPGIEHVFVIVLENKGFDTTFRAATDAPYLADTLTKQGALLRQYYGIGHFSLDNPTQKTLLDALATFVNDAIPAPVPASPDLAWASR